MTKGSLGGAERRVATAGVGSSPTPSTIRKKLRFYDRQLAKWPDLKGCCWWDKKDLKKLEALDKKRKEVRLQLKAYK